MNEIWKDIVGYEGYYQVSNLGRVKNNSEKIMKGHIIHNGYKRCTLWLKKKPKHFLIHRLVAESFLKKINGYEFVNHIDGNKLNNNLINIEWCNRSMNMIHAVSVLKKKAKNIKILYEHKEYEFNSYKDCAKFLKVTPSQVSCVARGLNKTKLYKII